MSTATKPSTDLSQTEIWVDGQGVEHQVAEMSVRYKTNVIHFIERRAPRIVGRAMADALITQLSNRTRFVPCVIGEVNGEAVECGATHEWAHGVWHGLDPFPGSEIDHLRIDEPGALPHVSNEAAVALVRGTPLMQRLIDDVEHGRGGDDG